LLKEYLFLQKHINNLYNNQNQTNTPCLQDIFSKKDYYNLLKIVLDTIKENKNASLTTLRLKLFEKSGLKETIEEFVYKTKITPGIILDFGTVNTRDTIICGNRQEVIFKNNEFASDILPIEQDTIFDLASTSKIFTCIAILKLKEAGLIDLFDPIIKYCPEFKNLSNVTIFDLLKFKTMLVTVPRIDNAESKEEAQKILKNIYVKEDQNFINAYTDMGALVLKYVIEKVSKMSFNSFVEEVILKPCQMFDTHLNVPLEKIYRVANENYSSIVFKTGKFQTRFNNVPGTPHDKKALSLGHAYGNAPGHAGYFSTKDDMLKLAHAFCHFEILNQESVFSISDNVVGLEQENFYTRFYGSLVYLKQPDPKYLSVYPPLSGRSFMSPGFAGTTLYVDPLNKITLFIGSNRLHNRIFQIHPEQHKNIKIKEFNQKTYSLSNQPDKIICSSFTADKEVLVKKALDLALQYQFLEKLLNQDKKLHLVREL